MNVSVSSQRARNAFSPNSSHGDISAGGDEEPSVTRYESMHVAFVETRALVRECFSKCLEEALGEGSVIPFASIPEWLSSLEKPPAASVALVSVNGKNHQGADISRELWQLRGKAKLPPIVVLSDAEDASDILSALDGGAKGYLPTSVPLRVAAEALYLVRAGGVFIPASSLMSARHALRAPSSTDRLRATGLFTERQAAVVEALRQGKANKIIAYELKMQESTVKVHVRNIMKKLKAHNRTQVAYLTQRLVEGAAT